MSWIPLQRYQVFHSSDLDYVRERVAHVLSPHRLQLMLRSTELNARMHSKRIGPACVSYMDYGADVRIVSEQLNTYSVVIVPIHGRTTIRMGNTTFDISSRRALVISAMDFVDMRLTAESKNLIFRFEQAALEARTSELLGGPLGKPLRFQPEMDLGEGRGKSWGRMAQLVVEELDRPGAAIEDLTEAHAYASILMTQLIRWQPNNFSVLLTRRVAPVPDQRVAEAIELIRAHPEWRHTTRSLAREVGAGERALQKAFRKHQEMTPTEFLRNERLKRVNEQLRSSSASSVTVEAVARRWGFDHHGHFAKQYRKQFGESPSDTLRKRNCGRLIVP